jgi:predicted SnoaL-like aldol condensation-catalyzing enzyme
MNTEDLTAIATRFLQLAAAGKARDGAAQLVTPDFRHHNVHFPGDGASLFAAMDQNAAQFPDKALVVVQAIREGDRVATLCRVRHTQDEAGYVVSHWFRFEGGKIAEVWDLAQEIPKTSPNQYGPL